MRFLLERGADANVVIEEDDIDATPLHLAAAAGYHDEALLLLDNGANIDARNSEGITPLFVAAQHDHWDVLRLLLHRGADLDARDRTGHDAVFYARQNFGISISGFQCRTYRLLADVRAAGGWRRYVREPRVRLLALRHVVETGVVTRAAPAKRHVKKAERKSTVGAHPLFSKDLATVAAYRSEARRAYLGCRGSESEPRRYGEEPPADAVLERLFFFADSKLARDAKRRTRASKVHANLRMTALPKEVFWHILKFWRARRDYDPCDYLDSYPWNEALEVRREMEKRYEGGPATAPADSWAGLL